MEKDNLYKILVGIDFGTTNTIVSIFHNNKPNIMKINNNYFIPSNISKYNNNFYCLFEIPELYNNILYKLSFSINFN